MSASWQDRPEAGSALFIRIFAWCALRIGRPVARLALWPIALYFLLVRRAERNASRTFLSHALNRPATLGDVLLHFHAFAEVVLDRLFLLTRPDRIERHTDGIETLDEVLDSGQGLVLLGAHLGSFEAARLLQRQRADVHLKVLMDREVNARASAIFDALGSDLDRQIIDRSKGGISVALEVAETLKNAGAVAMLADRCVDNEPAIEARFMGRRAALPRGPFELAVVSRAPVFMFLGLYEGSRGYRLFFRRLTVSAWRGRTQRAEAIEALAGEFAMILSSHARRYPYNWFNFFDFWVDDGDK